MNKQPKRQKRWFKEHYFPFIFPVMVLGAFVLWGLWPMLAPRWDQDRCSFGEVTNERYWQMREEVRDDVKNALLQLKQVPNKKYQELKVKYPADLSLLKRWNHYNTAEDLIKLYPQYLDIQRAILTSLVLKYAKISKTENEKLAYMHAIMREMGGWFTKSSKFQHSNKSKLSYSYKYIFSSSYFIHDLSLWPLTLIFRYTFIGSNFQISETNGLVEYSYTGYRPTNLIDGFYYTKMFPNGGCPTLISKGNGDR